MSLEGDVGELRTRRRVYDRQPAIAVADDEMSRSVIDTDVICIISEIDAADWRKVASSKEFDRAIARACNGEQVGQLDKGESLWLVLTTDPMDHSTRG